jgi:hypothetical protein
MRRSPPTFQVGPDIPVGIAAGLAKASSRRIRDAILPNPDPSPTPVPTPPPIPEPKPMREPDPDRLPDEAPIPNHDENDAPPQHSAVAQRRP